MKKIKVYFTNNQWVAGTVDAETWGAIQVGKLQAFNLNCDEQVIVVRWWAVIYVGEME